MASTKRGRVYFERRFKQVCKRQHPHSKQDDKKKSKRKIEVGFLAVGDKGEGRTVLLQALNFASTWSPNSGGRLTVEVHEGHEGVRITKRMSVSIDHDSFAMSHRGKIPETVKS